MLINIDIEYLGTPVARWPYGQATATDIILRFSRDSHTDEIERWLNEQFSRSPDSKNTFAMRTMNGATYYLTFFDGSIKIGKSVAPLYGDHLPEPQNPTK
jgi:hypothetical protein